MFRAFWPFTLLFLLSFFIGCSQEHSDKENVKSKKSSKPFTLTPPKDAAHVFVLHRFDDEKHKSTSISTKQLKELFEYLKTHHFHVASLDEVITKLKNNEALPKDWVLFSIDDSYKSFYENGFPLFKAYGYPFTIYIYIEATLRHYNDFMSWDQLKEISKFGELGLHSFGHKHMTKMNEAQMHEDTQKGLKIFEERLGFKPRSYAYPYGEFDEKLQKVITSYGFDLVFNQNVGAISHKSSILDLDRIALSGNFNVKPKLKIKYLPAQWNQINLDRENMILKSIDVDIDAQYKSVEVYISGDKWHRLKTKKGKITQIFDHQLKKGRTRIIIKTPDNRWSSKIIIL